MIHFVTVKELGKYLRLSETILYKLAASGKIPALKIGYSWRFDLGEVQKLIRKGRKGSNKEKKPGITYSKKEVIL